MLFQRPEARTLPAAIAAKPRGRGRIEWLLAVVAQERDRVSLDKAPCAFRAGIIVDWQPEKAHAADDAADRLLEREFARANVRRG